MEEKDIPDEVWQFSLVHDDEGIKHHRMDFVWSHMRLMKHPDGSPTLNKLAEVALLLLTLPRSNAAEERVFSLVTKNKTKFRPNLQLNGKLSGILTIKLATNGLPCKKYEPSEEVLTTAKKATMNYNKTYCKK